jgi:hypothetical protein
MIPRPTERYKSLWVALAAPEVLRLKSFSAGAAATAEARRAMVARNFILIVGWWGNERTE